MREPGIVIGCGDHLVHGVRIQRGAERQIAGREALGAHRDVRFDPVLILDANQCPIRPNPVTTSSAMNSMPCLATISRMRGRYPGGGGTTPPAPWMGSAMKAAMLCARRGDRWSRSSSATSPSVNGGLAHAGRTPIGIGRREMMHELVDVPEMRRAVAFAVAERHAEIGRPMIGVEARKNHAPSGLSAARMIKMGEAHGGIVGAGSRHRVSDVIQGARSEPASFAASSAAGSLVQSTKVFE